MAHRGLSLEQPTLEGLLCQKGPTLGQLLENGTLLEGPVLEKFMKSCIPWEKVHARVGEGHQEEGVEEMMCDELTTTSIPHPHAPLGGEQVEELGVKLSSRMEWGIFFLDLFLSVLLLQLICNKLH